MQCRARCLEKTVRRGWRGSDWVLNTIEKSFWSALAGEDFRLDGFGSVNQYICSRGLSFSNTFEPNERTPGSRVPQEWPPSDQRFTFRRLRKPLNQKPAPKKYPVDEVVALFKKTLGIYLRDGNTLHDYDWEKCREAALTDKDSTTPHRLAHILNFCKKTEKLDVELMSTLMDYVLIDPTAPSKITPVEASMVVQSIGMLSRIDSQKRGLKSRPQGGEDFFAGVGRLFVVKLLDECLTRELFGHRRFRPWELSNTLHGLGVLVHSTGGLDQGDAAIVENAVNYILQEFMKKTWFQGREGECTPQDFANVLHGCVNLMRFCDIDQGLTMGVVENMKATLSTQVPMSEQDLANVVWALGKLGIQKRDLLGVLCWRMTDVIGAFKAKSLANIVYGLGLLRFHKKDLMIKIGKQVVSAERIHEFKMQELTNIVYGFGLSGFFEARIFMILLKQISRRIEQFSAREVSNIVYGLGLLKSKGIDMISKSVGAFMEILVVNVLERNSKSFNSQDVANLCWGCGRLLFYDEQLMGFLVGRYMELVEANGKVQDFEVRMILEACHALDYPAQDFFDFADEVLRGVNEGESERSHSSEERHETGTDSETEEHGAEIGNITGGAEAQDQPKKECYQAVIDELANVEEDESSFVTSNQNRNGHSESRRDDVRPRRAKGERRQKESSDRYYGGGGGDEWVQKNSDNEGRKSWGQVLRRSRTRRERINLYQEFNELADQDQGSIGQKAPRKKKGSSP